MCYQKLQRLLMAIVLGIVLWLFALGLSGDRAMFQIAVVLQTLVIIMLIIWAFTDFCPSIWFLKKIFPPCEWEK